MMKFILPIIMFVGLAFFFVIRGQVMRPTPHNAESLRKAVVDSLHQELFEPIDCPNDLKKLDDTKTVKCFLTHLEYHEAMTAIASAMTPLVNDPKQMWTGLSGDWKSDYVYREDQSLVISFWASELVQSNSKTTPEAWKEFSTYVWFGVYENQ